MIDEFNQINQTRCSSVVTRKPLFSAIALRDTGELIYFSENYEIRETDFFLPSFNNHPRRKSHHHITIHILRILGAYQRDTGISFDRTMPNLRKVWLSSFHSQT